jgi:phosphomannomutase
VVALDALTRADRPLSEVLAPYRRYAASGEINRRVDGDPRKVIEEVAGRYPAQADRLPGRADRGGRRLVVQSATEQHRAAAPAERRGATEAEMARVRDEVLEAVGGEPA